ncbi:MAG: UDP-N-acetylmuramoyl-L-alanyl-D-glutamate--2,6-diaminopimelate ligase [Bacteroidota bacterium]
MGKGLRAITKHLKILDLKGNPNPNIQNIQFDSRKVEQSDVFVAVKGTQVDGHRFIPKAIEQGAKVLVAEVLPEKIQADITYLRVENSAEALGQLAANFYDHPSKKLKLVGITGTNGKTTTVNLLYDLFTALGYKTGLLSTIQNKVGQQILEATHTTPDALQLNRVLAQMVDAGCDYAFMEVSSHAIHQRRIAGVEYTGAIFSNISHDHLDYHGTFLNYIHAKKRLFDDLPKNSFALVNIDDKRGEVMLQNTKAQKNTYGLKRPADFKGKVIENSLLGLHLKLNEQEIFSRLIGGFNAYNLLAVYATAILLEQEETEVLIALSNIRAAEGRFDYIQSPKQNIIGIVDYAHTPDALLKVLETIQELKQKSQVITVVGCGGDRDRAKRPEMAKIACQWSDQVILTSDNPRSEVPEQIIEEMEEGVPKAVQSKVLSITNRKQAIKTACRLAKARDLILVAGKGHEKYQEINGVKHPFDDKAILKEELSGY